MQLFLNRLLTAVIFALMAAPAFAQKENQRYEVGRRLIKFEVDFEGIKDPLILKGISERLKPLTFYFFSGQGDVAGCEVQGCGVPLCAITLPTQKMGVLVLKRT